METRTTIAGVADYLKTQPLGTKCILNGGPVTTDHLNEEFTQRGVRISHITWNGQRIITSTEITEVRVIQLKEYKCSKRTTDAYLLSQVRKNGISANVPTFVQGNHTTLVRQLRKLVGAGNYMVQKSDDPRGEGWLVTVKIPILP